ncbi:hypothetical protein Zm00014a_041351 [Zea mays]|uniref:Uncharacterized protein n=2 Tax=Zea mays TaxID=4577 RepID=A0A3L6DAA0_MAIZE|nr:hypothetical protein Zm00014a_017605 [Zea mays]PWZ33092.1 hypothetical protein Zm00014a_041351 [Zea mays]
MTSRQLKLLIHL